MNPGYTFRTKPSLYSLAGKDALLQARRGLNAAFSQTVQPFIDRINRRGVGLKMVVGPEGAKGISKVVFTIEANKNLQIVADLSGGVLTLNGDAWGSREDFDRLTKKIVTDLIYMDANQRYEEPSLDNDLSMK